MKVLHIINSLYTGGAEKLLVDSLPLYSKYGVEVDLLLLNSDDTPFLSQLKNDFKGKIFLTNNKNYYHPIQLFAIKKYLKNYDIIHCHLFPVLYWAALAKILFFPSIKLIFTEHNTSNKRLTHSLFLKIDRFIYKYYNKIIAITPQVKQVLIEKLDLPPSKIEVIYNGIDVDKIAHAFAYQKSDFFTELDIILIQVSRFHKQKDQRTVIRALTHLPHTYKLLLVGEGELRVECEALVAELNLHDRVKFLGIRLDIPQLLKTSDIVIQSSHWEGFGLAAVEGMSAGKPTIASDVQGLGDIVRDYGLLFEKSNDKHLASQILTLQDTFLLNKIAEQCIVRARDFHINKMIESHIKLYQDLNTSI